VTAAPILVIAYGNPARGDDAAGPLLAEKLQAYLQQHHRWDIEVLIDFQLNIEHILDLQGRKRALIMDASCRSGDEVELRRIAPHQDGSHTTHAVTPGDLLASYERHLQTPAPPTELLTVPGESFELGASLSTATRAHLEQAWSLLQVWCLKVATAPAESA
jgi:hydrogenase maturation protease